MEDILASIRRILSEDEAEQPVAGPAEPHAEPHPEPHRAEPHPAPEPAGSEVLALDSSMMVEQPSPPSFPPPSPIRAEPPAPIQEVRLAEPLPPPSSHGSDALLGPEATAAAASSVGSLLRTLVAERQQVAVYRGGPTIEDLVREEIRPVLREWLDSNLPPMVERLVRAEIERVVGRAVS
jgi:cell pole-organizing protein PopZ